MEKKSRAKKPKVEYPPELMRPHVWIPVPEPFGLLGRSPEEQAAMEEEYRQRNLDILKEKLLKLAELHGTIEGDEIDWQGLAMALVFAHVKGFEILQEPPKLRGRPRKPDWSFAIYEEVLKIMDGGERSVVNACRTLSKRPGPWHRTKPETLESRFHEVKRRMQKFRAKPILGLLAPFAESQTTGSEKYPRPVMGGLFGLGSTFAIGKDNGHKK